MIAIGVIIMVLGFLGCCGAIRENRCMLLLVGIITLFFLHDLIGYSLNWLINISRKRKKQTTDKSHPHIMRWSETQPVYYFSLASVLHQPPHHLHPPAGSGNPGSCGGEEGKTGSDAIVSHLSSSHQLVRKFHCEFLVCRWRTGWRNVWRSLPRCRINQLKWRKTWSYCRQR